ncbi:MAG TPA: sugar-binding transcriptional regulator [Casimicrobiaceae bacterium]|jgi:DNA-binding transcriptional regulator LsrR (DeoR family)|nr:sugar-binding transcriptional regulator [Casimicrobiaceae bacterium]
MNESTTRLDDAARAGWLYYIAGKTQDDIARAMNISRPSAQRLVSLCRTDGLLSFRLNHPISAWMGLAARLTERFALTHCDVVPTAADARATASAVSEAAAIVIERVLRKDEPAIIAVGTGRSLRASVTRVTPMSRPHHRLVSLAGNISPDGSASPYNALETLAGLTGAPAFPLPLPMHAADAAQRDLLLRIGCVQRIFAMAAAADVWFSGLSQFDPEAALFRDGFLNRDELLDVMRAGAVGATLAWAFDADGNILDHDVNRRVTSVRPQPSRRPRICVAHGPRKVPALRAALKGRLVNGLVTDEATARALLDEAASAPHGTAVTPRRTHSETGSTR